ncbi:MAG: hypothetical protein JSW11_04625 [Candidatus Heimdallarchaeota archaeon]|nr:MAG: hypothetical protein JSW11_04625 [Candidatus Heimdallarchaeota archaeon]
MFEEILDLLLPIIVIVAGIIGLAYGINKLIKSKDDESTILKYLALATSIVIGLVNLWAIYEWVLDDLLPFGNPDVSVEMVHWLTVLLIFLAGSSMLAEPLKDTPIAAIVATIAFGALAGILLFYADLSGGFSNIELGAINIPLWLVILLIVIIVAILFVITWFTEFTIDRILQLISWAPVVIILCGLLTIQGLLVFLLGDAGGIWALTRL